MDNKIPATNFMATIAANVDNNKLSDTEFREFIRNTLPIVEFDMPQHLRDKLKQREQEGAVLGDARCACCGNNDGKLYLHGKCHINSPTWCIYHFEGFVEVICATCKKQIAMIKVAENPFHVH
jgi:hypothetical protein